jgi:hypothetical protein
MVGVYPERSGAAAESKDMAPSDGEVMSTWMPNNVVDAVVAAWRFL